MDSERLMKIIDSCWFEMEILKKQSRSSISTNFEANPDHTTIQEKPPKQEILRISTHHKRSMSTESSSETSFDSVSLSPDSVLFTSKLLHTILSQKEEEETEQDCIQDSFSWRRKKRNNGESTKSLSDLEFEELKGFMDLGFIFTEEDKDSKLVEIVPGLQRLGKTESDFDFDESAISRPYLSEAWEVMDRRRGRRKENHNPMLMNWRIPAFNNEIDMKDNLRWWAHTVASAVR